MPYLQLDVDGPYPSARKRALAQRMCASYAQLMQVDARRISVVIRECGEGAVWRLVDGDMVPAAVLMLDIRRGRSPEQRLAVAYQLIADCGLELGLPVAISPQTGVPSGCP